MVQNHYFRFSSMKEQEVHIVYKLTADANSEGDVEIYTTPKGWDLETQKISVAFDPATDYDLEISIFDGIRQVAPTTGVFVGKAMAFNTTRVIEFEEGSKIIVHYKNSNATTARTAIIEVLGFLKPE